MIVAQIAYNHLAPAVKAKCDALIAVPLANGGSKTSTFVTASCWADDYKSQLGSGAWHYIDLPFSLDGTSTSGAGPAASNVVWALNRCLVSLGSGTATQSDQATSLRYLVHFVGDVHQPLHSSTAVWAARSTGDAGGNLFYLNGTWNNLHFLWDDGAGYLSNSISRPLTSDSQNTINSKVAAMESKYPYVPGSGAIADPMDWAREGMETARTVAYAGIAQNSTPSAVYLNQAQAAAQQRLALAGHRLADLLNALFTTNAVRLACSSANGNFRVSWNAVPGRTYHIQWKQAFTDPAWTALKDLSVTSNSAFIAEPASRPQRIYRVTQ